MLKNCHSLAGVDSLPREKTVVDKLLNSDLFEMPEARPGTTGDYGASVKLTHISTGLITIIE